jgi:hypothetical protein
MYRFFGNRLFCRTATFSLALASMVLLASTARAQWTPPTDEELKMTSQPEVPGARAVYLYREEITTDNLHDWSKYARVKILTEGGKDLADVELSQYNTSYSGGYTVSDIAGRTIHPDGTIIPFTGKPLQKLIGKGPGGDKFMAKVFTLPDVEVGSIIEYRYHLRYDDDSFMAPKWFVQSDLYTRKAHYLWKPTDLQLVTKSERGEQLTSSIAWFHILPSGFDVTQKRLPPASGGEPGQLLIELNVHDIAPVPDEDHMPPFASFTYRVLFYYTPYRTAEEYWKNEGKGWAKNADKFIGPDNKVKQAVTGLVAASDTPDQKLRKIYAAMMKLDNTSYNRERSAAEDKSQGLSEPKSTDDIWERKRGTDDQMAKLFVAMARAAGMKAYLMAVTNRDRNYFFPAYLSFSQLDPGQRYCPYGTLAWKHGMAEGLRQTDSGSAIVLTPGYSSANIPSTHRIANLIMDDHGEVTGTIQMTWSGAPALNWRQQYLRSDITNLNRELRESMERMLPGGMEVRVGGILKLEDYEQPLTVTYEVKGPIGSSAGKRLLIPNDIFEATAKPVFPHEKRDNPIAFQYPEVVLDAMRVTFPASIGIESVPGSEQIPYQKFAVYSLKTESTPTSITVRREFQLGNILYKLDEYPELRGFYTKLETKDQEPVVLKAAAPAAGGN